MSRLITAECDEEIGSDGTDQRRLQLPAWAGQHAIHVGEERSARGLFGELACRAPSRSTRLPVPKASRRTASAQSVGTSVSP